MPAKKRTGNKQEYESKVQVEVEAAAEFAGKSDAEPIASDEEMMEEARQAVELDIAAANSDMEAAAEEMGARPTGDELEEGPLEEEPSADALLHDEPGPDENPGDDLSDAAGGMGVLNPFGQVYTPPPPLYRRSGAEEADAFFRFTQSLIQERQETTEHQADMDEGFDQPTDEHAGLAAEPEDGLEAESNVQEDELQKYDTEEDAEA